MAPKGIPIYLRLIQQQQKKIAKLAPVTKTRSQNEVCKKNGLYARRGGILTFFKKYTSSNLNNFNIDVVSKKILEFSEK